MKTASTLKWLFRLTGAFLRNAPVATIVVVLLTLCSQMAMTLATLLPLKVVMLLGSEGIPRFFPKALMGFERNNLILGLVALSFAAYIANILFTKFSEKTTERGVDKLVKKTQKIILFENQDSFASGAYTKYTIALAGLIFFLIIVAVFGTFYPQVALLTIAFLILSYLVTYILYLISPTVQLKIKSKPNAVTTSISNIGFLLIFLYIVIDFLYLTPPNFIVGLVTIILGRLMLSRLSFTVAYILSLKRDESKINALFFHNHVFLPTTSQHNDNIWDLLITDAMNTWLPYLLDEAGIQQNDGNITTEWRQTQLQNILILRVIAEEKTFLVKIYDERLSTQALHESTLMLETDSYTFPSPTFLLATKVEKYPCHLFDITGFDFLSNKEALKARHEIDEQLLVICPSEELIGRYRRSKAFLWERINQDMLNRLRLIFKDQAEVIENFENAVPQIKSILESLPLYFVNQKLNNSSVMKNTDNRAVSFHWPTWSIEPVGTGLETNQEKVSEIDELIKTSTKQRHELNQFPLNFYKIAALISAIEQSFHRQQYRDVMEFIPRVLEQLQTTYDCDQLFTSSPL